MNSLLRAVTRFDDSLGKLEAGVLIALVAAMTLIVFLQVIYRYVLTQSLSWSEELARYLFAWISLLGAALAVKKRGHFGLELFYEMLPRRGRRSLGFTIHLLMGAVILVILVQGFLLYRKVIDQQSPAMEISMGWAYACVPVGAALMAAHLLVIFLKDALGTGGHS